MPLAFVIPLGQIMVVTGVILHLTTNYKKIVKVIIGLGLAVTILTIGVIVLAVGSM